MTAKDHIKLLDAGFAIIRKRDFTRISKEVRHEIFIKTPTRREWHSLDWHLSKSERDVKMKQLLKDTKIVED
jgi:hypothetical protein